MKQITEQNVADNVDIILKELGMRYTVVSSDNIILYSFPIGYSKCMVQIELSETKTEQFAWVQFILCDVDNFSKEVSTYDELYDEISELISMGKNRNETIQRIDICVDKIRLICKECEIQIEDFITVNYNFEQ